MKHVGHAWEAVVAPHQAGLSDPRAGPVSSALSAGEAWHHWQAAQQGVIDSARFLVAFSVVPSLQQGGGSRLHAAAARGLLEEVKALLEEEESMVHARTEDGTTPLHAAAATGQAAVISALLDAGADPQVTSRNGATALHVASAMGHVGATDALLGSGATLVDAPHKFAQCTALHFAAEMGHVAVVSALCAAGADANARKTTGGTPLHTAADCDQPRSVAALLAPPCHADHTLLMNGDTSALYLASQRGFSVAAAALLDAGADPNFEMPNGVFSTAVSVPGTAEPLHAGGFYEAKNTERANGATALHAAVENGHAATVAMLLRRGARQLASMEGVPPLLLALQYRHPEIALALARATPVPDLDAREPQTGASALFVAAGEGYATVVRALLELGASADLPNRHGATALSHAAVKAHADTARLLLDAGASPSLGPPDEGGVLHAALRGGGLRGRRLASFVGTLLSRGAAVEATDAAGASALMLAAGQGEAAACAALLQAGADAGRATPPPSSLTALMKAAAKGHVAVVKLLLDEGGADPNARAGVRLHGATALYLAAQGTHAAAAQALLERGAHVDAAVTEVNTTPLFAAAERGDPPTVGTLLRHGADPRAHLNWNGLNAAHMAAVRGHVAVLELLRKHDAAGGGEPLWEARTGDGSTALILVAAAEEALTADKQQATLRWLVHHGAVVEARRTADGSTALLAAVAAGNAGAVRCLLREAGASHAAAANDGKSALLLATERGDFAVVRELMDGGAPSEPRALEAAITRREHDLIALLSRGDSREWRDP